MQIMIKHLLIGCAFAAAAMAQAAPKQGVTEWKLASGKLILVAGTYQDTTSYKRSMTFYHQEKTGAEWMHVPIAEGKVDFPLTFFSISSGETTVEDAVVVARGEDFAGDQRDLQRVLEIVILQVARLVVQVVAGKQVLRGIDQTVDRGGRVFREKAEVGARNDFFDCGWAGGVDR